MAFGYNPQTVQPVLQQQSVMRTAQNPENEECIQLLQRAITNLDMYKHWSEEAFLQGQYLGLQGEKRRERDKITEVEYCIAKDLQSMTQDAFGVMLRPEEKRLEFSDMDTPEKYFHGLKHKLWLEYHDLHEIANRFIVIGYKPLACDLYEWVCCLWDMIIEIQRFIKEQTLNGWNYHNLLIYQVSFHNVHDYYEKHYPKKTV